MGSSGIRGGHVSTSQPLGTRVRTNCSPCSVTFSHHAAEARAQELGGLSLVCCCLFLTLALIFYLVDNFVFSKYLLTLGRRILFSFFTLFFSSLGSCLDRFDCNDDTKVLSKLFRPIYNKKLVWTRLRNFSSHAPVEMVVR